MNTNSLRQLDLRRLSPSALAVLAAGLAFAAPAAAHVTRLSSVSQYTVLSQGFSADAGRVRCAVHLPHQAGLLCAATGIKRLQYDGRGLIELKPNGQVSIMPSGSDKLLAIDGDRDSTPRPVLAPGHTWDRDGFSCTNLAGAVTCRHAGHGFRISGISYRRF